MTATTDDTVTGWVWLMVAKVCRALTLSIAAPIMLVLGAAIFACLVVPGCIGTIIYMCFVRLAMGPAVDTRQFLPSERDEPEIEDITTAPWFLLEVLSMGVGVMWLAAVRG